MTAVERLFDRVGKITGETTCDPRFKVASFHNLRPERKGPNAFLLTVIEETDDVNTARWILYGGDALKLVQEEGNVNAYSYITTPDLEYFEPVKPENPVIRRLERVMKLTERKLALAA